MSDIFIKNAGQGSAGWRKASNIWVKTSGLGSTGWRSAAGVWIRNATQWLRVWPLSGIFATRVPYIADFSSDTYANRLTSASKLRIGTSYFGDNAQWDLNGWAASSYTYKWKLYDQFGQDLGVTLRSGTGSGWTSTAGEDQLPTSVWTSTNSTSADSQFLAFEVTANNSSNSQYNGVSLSTKIQVIREQPVNLTASLSTNTPTSGTAITYSSTWQTGEAYKADPSRTFVQWYTNSTSTTVGGAFVGNGSSYTPVAADSGKYIYVTETRQNSGTDYDLGILTGVQVSRVTTSPVGISPNAFTYSLTNISSVTTPSAPVQQRVSTTSNTVLVEMSSAFPSDTESYELWTYGSGSAAGGTLANPSVQSITTLNQYFSNGDIAPNGTFDTVTNISPSASNSPISTISKAIGPTRTLQFNVSTTTGAQSWRINYTISGASGGNGTYTLDTNSMPRQTIIGGVSNPTVTINSITAYSGLDQTGSTTTGTAGFPTSLSSITKPSAFSTTSTSNYTFYTNLQVTGSQRRVTLPSAFTSGTTIYVSTNGYINWGGDDPTGLTYIPTSGITVAPLAGDLRQGAVSASGTTSTGGLWVFSDSTNYWVTWWGNYYQDAAQVARYQVKFYWGQSYADIYIVNNSLTTLTPSTTAVQNGANSYQNWSATTSQTSTLLSTASMNRISTQDGVDDNRTAVVASAPVLTWTVTWNAAGGTGGGTTTLARGLSHTAPTPGTRDGFDFAHYRYPASGGTDPVFVSSGGSYTPTQNVEFGAIWTTKTYTVSYNANGGTGAPSSQTKTHGVALTLSSTTPTRATVGNTSYTFNGWNTASDATGTNYSAGGSYTANAAVTLYAKWTETTISTKLATPTNLSATTTRTDGINITWGAVTGAAYYGVWYRGSAPLYDSPPDFPNITATSYLDTSIGAGVTRSYDVQAYRTGNPAGTKSEYGGPVTGTRAAASTPATAPGIPGTPTNGWTSGLSYPFSWTAATPGTVSGGGAATISSYQIRIYRASDSAGTGSTLYNTYTSLGSGTNYTFTAPDGLYYAAAVSATNSAGLSSSSYSGISAYK